MLSSTPPFTVGFQTTTLTARESQLDMVNVQIVVSGTPPPFLPNEVVVTVSLLNDTFAGTELPCLSVWLL